MLTDGINGTDAVYREMRTAGKSKYRISMHGTSPNVFGRDSPAPVNMLHYSCSLF